MHYLCIVMKRNIELPVKLSKKINLYKSPKCILNVAKITIWYLPERGIGLPVLILYYTQVYKMCPSHDGGSPLDFTLLELSPIMAFIGPDLLFYVTTVLEKHRSREVQKDS